MRRFPHVGRLAEQILSLAFVSSLVAVGCGGATGTDASPNSPAGTAHPLIGSAGPDFSQKAVKDGRAVSLHALRGKVAIVDFWATWCEPCKKSFPKVQGERARDSRHLGG
jgi:thiol-disulfide isomerase/thioredoxin